MPRIATTNTDWGLAALITPLLGAAVGAGVAASLTKGTWRGGAVVGAASQLPALPAYIEQLVAMLEMGFLMDAVFLTGLLCGFLSIAMVMAAAVAIWVRREAPPPFGTRAAAGLVAGGLAELAVGVTALTVVGAGWHNVAALSLGAACLFWAVVAGARGSLRQAAVPLLVGSLGVAAFAAAFVAFARFL